MFPTGVAVLGVKRLETVAAVRPALFHDVALSSQYALTLKTAEVLHVPVSTLGLGALVREDDLKGGTERMTGRWMNPFRGDTRLKARSVPVY